MRILFVAQVMLGEPMGGTRHVLAVCRELVKQGHEVTLIAPGQESAPIPGVSRRRPPSRLRPGVRMEAALTLLAVREVRRSRPDAAYIRISPSTSLLPVALAGLDVPVALELNGSTLEELRKLGRGELSVRVVQSVMRRVARRAGIFIGVDQKIARHAREAFDADNVIVIENGADLEVATPGDRGDARRRLGMDPSAKYVVFTGTLVPELRLDLLFEAHRRLDDVVLVVVGAGPQSERLERHARDSDAVMVIGARPHEEALDYVRAADVCVNVRVGSIGMKCFEYAAMGRRFVTFESEDVGRLTALYGGRDAVHVVHEESAQALEAALRKALAAELEQGPLEEREIEEARRQLGWNRTAREIAEALGRITPAQPPLPSTSR